ncbi:MAG: alpha/beta hydrolase [Bifidobacterium sp.]|jgi:acetyl esterase/lipase|nr:alpha/beta hydrolase [Bifidobacterium sp.]
MERIRHIISVTCDSARYDAELTLYMRDIVPLVEVSQSRHTIVICPGGGYRDISARESDPTAIRFLDLGFNVAILKYSVFPAKFPVALLQLMAAMDYLAALGPGTSVDPKRISVLGFSAGGHLCGCLAENWNNPDFVSGEDIRLARCKPYSVVLCYPVITTGQYGHRDSFSALGAARQYETLLSLEHNVTELFPPAFIWHTQQDQLVDVRNSLLLVGELVSKGVPCEFHMYQRGRHGLGIANAEAMRSDRKENFVHDADNWPAMACRWINAL